jgi:hypothetical protein
MGSEYAISSGEIASAGYFGSALPGENQPGLIQAKYVQGKSYRSTRLRNQIET